MKQYILLIFFVISTINCFNKEILITLDDIKQSTSSTQCKVLCEEASSQLELFCNSEIDDNLLLTKYCVDEQVDKEFLCKQICQENKIEKRNKELDAKYPIKTCKEKLISCKEVCNDEEKCLTKCSKQNSLCEQLEQKLNSKSLWRKYFDDRSRVESYEQQEQLKHGFQKYKKTEL